MREIREFICIRCPYGCRLRVTIEGGRVQEVRENRCNRGRDYALQEAVMPMRVITSLMRARGREKPFGVKTDAPVPQKLFFDCVNLIRRTTPDAPIRCGEVILQNILGTGVNVVATVDMD
jgi:CxxC motif-containing protein